MIAYRLVVDGSEFAVLEWPSAGPRDDDRLTPVERAVISLALRGCSNADIAARRGSAARTVANELAGAYRKLGVRSRAELAAWATQRRGSS